MNNEILIYQTEDGKVKIETHFENEFSMRKIVNHDFSTKLDYLIHKFGVAL